MPNPNLRPRGTSYIPTLDGWRAVAIIAVLFCHGLNRQRFPFAESLGSAGVLLFFAISGFLITRRMVEEKQVTGTISLRKFYVRRLFRILPPALFYLGMITGLGLVGVVPYSPAPILKALLFVRNYTHFDFANPATWYSAHFWSLSVEEHFYLIWPGILVLAGLKRARWVAPGLALATVLWRTADQRCGFVIGMFDAPYLTSNWGRTDYVADVLLWGCALAVWLGPLPWKSVLTRRMTTLACVSMVAVIYVAFFVIHSGIATALVNLLMALLVACTVTAPDSLAGRLLELAPVRFIGRLSYSLYLWQQMFFHMSAHWRWFQESPINIPLIFACGCLSYYLVERPAVRLGHRFARPPRLGHADDLTSARPIALEA